MRYLRCQCGKEEAWSSMGSLPCVVCPDCGTTLAESPMGHYHGVHHEVYAEMINDKISASCRVCGEKFPIKEAINLESLYQQLTTAVSEVSNNIVLKK